MMQKTLTVFLVLAFIGTLPALVVMALALWSMQFELRDVPRYFIDTVIDIGPIPFLLSFGLFFIFYGMRKLIAYLSR